MVLLAAYPNDLAWSQTKGTFEDVAGSLPCENQPKKRMAHLKENAAASSPWVGCLSKLVASTTRYLLVPCQ